MSDFLHIQDEQKPKLTLCGAWSRSVTLLGDDFDADERSVCLRCTRRLLALRIHARLVESQCAPSGHAMACGCARCVDRRGRHEDWLGITPGGVPIVVDEPQGAPHSPECKCRTCWGFEAKLEAKGTPQKPAFPTELDGSALEQPSDEGQEGQE